VRGADAPRANERASESARVCVGELIALHGIKAPVSLSLCETAIVATYTRFRFVLPARDDALDLPQPPLSRRIPRPVIRLDCRR